MSAWTAFLFAKTHLNRSLIVLVLDAPYGHVVHLYRDCFMGFAAVPRRRRLHGLSGGADVGGFLAFRARAAFERDALVFGERLEASSLNVLEMDKQVWSTLVRCDEAEAFGFVEPFNDAGLRSHDSTSQECRVRPIPDTRGDEQGQQVRESDGSRQRWRDRRETGNSLAVLNTR